ncbi:hypothetical protein MMC31_003316, partial [Peltigera leucophlebia]|nr:hypothetical protein [Peltigera leucophlebia]
LSSDTDTALAEESRPSLDPNPSTRRIEMPLDSYTPNSRTICRVFDCLGEPVSTTTPPHQPSLQGVQNIHSTSTIVRRRYSDAAQIHYVATRVYHCHFFQYHDVARQNYYNQVAYNMVEYGARQRGRIFHDRS